MADHRVRIEEIADLDSLPEAARALFGADAFSTAAWYRSVVAAGLEAGSRPCFQVAWHGGVVLGVVPMLRSATGYAAMTTPYTALWSPMLRPGLARAALVAVGHALGRVWRGWPTTRLDALDPEAPWVRPVVSGLRQAGLVPLRFDHFGNWHLGVAGLGWPGYLAGRPGALRSAVARRGRRLMQGAGGIFAVLRDADEVEAGIAAYERVYDASWKEAEPFPRFAATLIRESAAAGSLRLGLLSIPGETIAAQLWLVHEGWAGVQKLAHDEAHRQLAPGTVLTALMVQYLMETDGVDQLDFGRGDDPYKKLWTGERRQRTGLLLATPWRRQGLAKAARHVAGRSRNLLLHVFGKGGLSS